MTFILCLSSVWNKQTVPARKDAFATFCHLKMDDCDPETLPTSHCGVLSTTLLIRRLTSLTKNDPCHFLACNWSCFVCSEYSPVTSVAVSLEKKMLSIKMSANFHHAFTKDSQVFETRQWNADYKVIRTPNIYCLLKMLYWQFRWKSLLFCSLQDCGSLTFKYQSCLWYFS